MFRANRARSGQPDLFNLFEEAFTAFATINTNLPIERQILGGLASSVQAISHIIPEDREVTPRVAQLLHTADAIAGVAGNENVDLEHRILLGIAQGLQGIGGVTPAEDFVTQEIGKLIVRVNAIVKYAKDNEISDGLKLIQCSGEGILGLVECISKIIQGVDALQARNLGITAAPQVAPEVPVEPDTSIRRQITLMFSRKNHVKDVLREMPQHVQDKISYAANQTVLQIMNASFKLTKIMKENLDKDLIVTKIPMHMLAEAYVEVAKFHNPELNHAQKMFAELFHVYKSNETLISNLAALTAVLGSIHLLYNIDYNIPTFLAAAGLYKINAVLDQDQMTIAGGVFAASMIIKDNVLPGTLLLLAAWMALVPSLVEKDLLSAMVESKYLHETRHRSLRG